MPRRRCISGICLLRVPVQERVVPVLTGEATNDDGARLGSGMRWLDTGDDNGHVGGRNTVGARTLPLGGDGRRVVVAVVDSCDD